MTKNLKCLDALLGVPPPEAPGAMHTCSHSVDAELRELLLRHAGAQRHGEPAHLCVQPGDVAGLHAGVSFARKRTRDRSDQDRATQMVQPSPAEFCSSGASMLELSGRYHCGSVGGCSDARCPLEGGVGTLTNESVSDSSPYILQLSANFTPKYVVGNCSSTLLHNRETLALFTLSN